ncbi:MAG: hypothetical protein U9P12_07460 [Verrucomicrobiota bacterium]|nr:hypothetical protein [Verrucomicrobiota bacterium]
MLRALRVIGIIVFAVLVGIAANTLWKMHETGELLEAYNSSRKTNVTLIVFSLVALGTLGYFELAYVNRLGARRGYGSDRQAKGEGKDVVDSLDTTSIYAAPKTMDAWQGRRSHSSKSRHRRQKEPTTVWMGLLRICCVLMPFVYVGLLGINLAKVAGHATKAAWLLPSIFAGMTLVSIIASIGILTRKTWSMGIGYLLAMCNLMIFPVGTALGLFLLMGLVGASSEFASPDRERRRAARRKAARKLQTSAI